MAESAKTVSDELDDLARALRQGAGREMREEAAIDEQLTELQRRRRHDLSAAMRLAMHRGDTVTVAVAGMTLKHPLVAVGADYLTLDGGDRAIDVALAQAVITLTPSRHGGRSGDADSPTLRARMAELEQAEASVEVVTADGRVGMGRVEVVAPDHVVISHPGGGETYVPLAAVAIVFSRTPPRRR